MLDGIEPDRFGRMTDQELRWFDNIKKAFYESDMAAQSGRIQDYGLQELFKAVDTAKTLRRSLRGEDTLHHHNRQRFLDFLSLASPIYGKCPSGLVLHEKSADQCREYTLGEVLYDIRCKVHENENLNAAEAVDYHIQLDWSRRDPFCLGELRDGTLNINAHLVWQHLRKFLSKFITGLETFKGSAEGAKSFCITIAPPMGSIRPDRKPRG